jgi:4-aminobutyrate aminotransferase/(S)-3-amino-2-methylpropionate transaminase
MATILIRTELPGPRSRALMDARRKAVARGPFHATPIFVARAHGAVVEDVDGNRLVDLASGIAVNNLGHTPDAVVAAVKAQATNLLHASFNVLPYEGYVALATRLNALVPGAFPKKTFLANSGAEAVENAVKIARAYTKRQAVLAFEHAFHGRTHMAMSLTSKALPYRHGFGPFAPEVYRAPFPYAYRSEARDSLAGETQARASGAGDDVATACLRSVRAIVEEQLGADQVAAIVVEPVLGEGGVVPAPPTFLRGLRALCDSHGIVLVFDEIQTGLGRTGTLFACEQLGAIPDLTTIAKALGSGLPIAAVTGRAEIMDAPIEGGIGGTFGGNPVACAAALAVLDAFEADGAGILARAKAIGEALEARLDLWKERRPCIGDARGLGPMRGIEIVKDRVTKEPDKAAAAAIARRCYERGVVVLTGGTYGNVIRLLPPLVIEDGVLAEALSAMEAAFSPP